MKDEDDVWGSSDEDDKEELIREGRYRERNCWNSGYRDGIDEGKLESVQEGFDIGFPQGATAGYEWGSLRGVISTLQAFSGQLPDIDKMAEEIAIHEKRLSKSTQDTAATAFLESQAQSGTAPPPHASSETADKCCGGGACGADQTEAPARGSCCRKVNEWAAVKSDIDKSLKFLRNFGLDVQVKHQTSISVISIPVSDLDSHIK
eukprot:CAMPEP_0196572462 /NCGR_PEP_ID=MMETSP1081-20130531/2515_1 /TAXON_ID=36882 /ORGANISM="Pyramimonas amylifera, Strain CCMP720" /LENGTH=204 /DNA_ID=CAMNT_0041889797 /DNA_START=594 /DNA_END=1208 /DNA_ORIENTATION=+